MRTEQERRGKKEKGGHSRGSARKKWERMKLESSNGGTSDSSHLPYTCGAALIPSRKVHRPSVEQEGRHIVLGTAGPKVEVKGLKLDSVCEPPTRRRLKGDIGLVDSFFTGQTHWGVDLRKEGRKERR